MGLAGVIAFRWIPLLLASVPIVFPKKTPISPFNIHSNKMPPRPTTPNFLPGANLQAPNECLTVGGGCFWGVEKLFRTKFPSKLLSTQVGYAGGQKINPTYQEVCTGTTGHFEAVRLCYFKDKTSPEEILEYFWSIHDPTTKNRQGPDVGPQYRSAVCVSTPQQLEAAKKLYIEMEKKWGKEFKTEIITEKCEFWPAEDYHQLYLEKHEGGYCTHKNHFSQES